MLTEIKKVVDLKTELATGGVGVSHLNTPLFILA